MILFMGVAGAGKSVQGRHLSDHLGFPWVSTGELLRMHVGGDKRQRMLKGELLTDQELYEVIDPVLKDLISESQIIIDGFPRTLAQAEWLYDFSTNNKTPISCVMHLEADEEIVTERLLLRGRPDDTREAISRRFREYKEVTVPILKHYEELGIPLACIDGNDDEVTVRLRIEKDVKKLGLDK